MIGADALRREGAGMRVTFDESVRAHWHHGVDGLTGFSSQEFYTALRVAIENRELPDVHISTATHASGAMFTGWREYLRVNWGDLDFDICAAPFGQTFFFSWWLIERPGCLTELSRLPVIGWPLRYFVTRETYFRADSRMMFQTAIHTIVVEQVSAECETRGRRIPTELDRKPLLREFWK
jgi:hypothetical protein